MSLQNAISAIGATALLLPVSAAFSLRAYAQPGGLFQKPHVLFIQQDRVVTFDFTPRNDSQPLGGGQGAQVGTATGGINGTTVVNFKFTFTSNPSALPLTFTF